MFLTMLHMLLIIEQNRLSGLMLQLTMTSLQLILQRLKLRIFLQKQVLCFSKYIYIILYIVDFACKRFSCLI